mmetsp:Transcript_30924/g.80919  ORF Transcript_30924/g.80919 Transcript_30924/m.80919 type:complete len:211 (-) Transcript_30924:1556-2188(-)
MEGARPILAQRCHVLCSHVPERRVSVVDKRPQSDVAKAVLVELRKEKRNPDDPSGGAIAKRRHIIRKTLGNRCRGRCVRRSAEIQGHAVARLRAGLRCVLAAVLGKWIGIVHARTVASRLCVKIPCVVRCLPRRVLGRPLRSVRRFPKCRRNFREVLCRKDVVKRSHGRLRRQRRTATIAALGVEAHPITVAADDEKFVRRVCVPIKPSH